MSGLSSRRVWRCASTCPTGRWSLAGRMRPAGRRSASPRSVRPRSPSGAGRKKRPTACGRSRFAASPGRRNPPKTRSRLPAPQRRLVAGAPLRMPQLAADGLRPVGAHLRDASPALRQYVDGQLLIAAQAISGSANALYGAAALDMPRRGVAHVRGGIGKIAETSGRGDPGLWRAVLTEAARDDGRARRGRDIAGRAQRGEDFPAQTVLFNLPPWDAGRLMAGDAPDALRRARRPADGWGAFMTYVGLDGSAIPAGVAAAPAGARCARRWARATASSSL